MPFDEQVRFYREKLDVPTRAWTDLWQKQHDVAFVVAGAARDELLSDLRGAVQAAIEDGETLASFRNRFDGIVAKHGWSYNGGRDWRTRVIYGTNLRTSYAAGRWQQLQAVRRSRPYWRYRHSPASVTPRERHVEWDGLVLRADDPWWRTHYPPNGWGCNCYVEALSEREVKRLGKDEPDEAPALDEREVTVGSGPGARTVDVPAGIDPGFAYAPGRSVVGDAQRIAIDAAQRRARSAASDAARLAEMRMIQSSQAAGFDSDAFRRFIRSSEARDAQEWAVATVSRERLREIGLDGGALAVRLSSDTAAAKSHRDRWSNFAPVDWERVQTIVDRGRSVVRSGERRILWTDGDGKPWMLVLKRSSRDELYMVSYRRAGPREAEQWGREASE